MAEPLLNPDPDAPSLVGGEYGAPAFQSVEQPSGERTVENVPRATMVQPAPLPPDFGVFHDLVPQERPQVGGVDFGVFSDLIPKPPPSITPASDAVVAATDRIVGGPQVFSPEEERTAVMNAPDWAQALARPAVSAGKLLAGQIPTSTEQLTSMVPMLTGTGTRGLGGFVGEAAKAGVSLAANMKATTTTQPFSQEWWDNVMPVAMAGLQAAGIGLHELPTRVGKPPVQVPPVQTEVLPTGPPVQTQAVEPAAAMRPPPETPTTEAAAEPTIVAEPAPETPAATEKIVASAFKLPSGEVVNTGALHGNAPDVGGEPGFITSTGRFVGREEAGQIATGVRQPLRGEDFFENADIIPSLREHPIAKTTGDLFQEYTQRQAAAEQPPTVAEPAPSAITEQSPPTTAPITTVPVGERVQVGKPVEQLSLEELKQRRDAEIKAITENLTPEEAGYDATDAPSVKALNAMIDVHELRARKGTVISPELGDKMLKASAQQFEKYKQQAPPQAAEPPQGGISKVVYHGSKEESPQFQVKSIGNDIGIHFGSAEQADWRVGDEGTVKPYRIEIKNPLRLDDPGGWYGESAVAEINKKIGSNLSPSASVGRIRDAIQKAGYDGVVYKNKFEHPLESPDEDSYIVFNKDQIKPAEQPRVAEPPLGGAVEETKLPPVKPNDKIYDNLLGRGNAVGPNLYELTEKQVTPALRKKLDVRGRPEETDSFSLRPKADVTGNPYDRGWILKDKRPDFARRATPPRVAEPPLGGETKYMHPSERPEVPKITEVPPERVPPEPESNDWTTATEPIEKQAGKLRLKADQEGGFVDLSGVADLGRRIYERGVDFARWSAEMIRHLGEKIKPHLQAVWDSLTGKNMLPGTGESGGIGKTGRRKAAFGAKLLPGYSELDALTGKRSAKLQKSTADVERITKEFKKTARTPKVENAMSAWAEAQGDLGVLKQQETAAKGKMFRQAAKDAQKLTPEQQALALKGRQTFDIMGKRVQHYGMLNNFRQNYVPHLFDVGMRLTGFGSAKLQSKFKFAKAAKYQSFFEADQAGLKPKTMEMGKLLGLYTEHANQLIADRQFVQGAQTARSEAGEPLAIPRGRAGPVQSDSGGQAVLVNPHSFKTATDLKGNPVDQTKYQVNPDQPALRKWLFAGKDTQGKPIFMEDDLAIHPELAKRLKAMTGRSRIRQLYDQPGGFAGGPTAFGRAILKHVDTAQAVMKREMFGLLAPFHLVQEATHAIGHTVNPLFNIPKMKKLTPEMVDAAEHGLMLKSERGSTAAAMEGVGGKGQFTAQIARKFGGRIGRKVADVLDGSQDWLFEHYIPGLKFKTYEHMLPRNMKTYAKELASGEVTAGDVKMLTAQQANAAYGKLNLALLDRSPTLQHIMQLTMIAPDFLEARGKFVGQAAKSFMGSKAGQEQLRAIAVLAMTQAGTAYVITKALGGEWDPKKPFEVQNADGTRSYFMRSVPEDFARLVLQGTDKRREFVSARINPLVNTAYQIGVSGRNYRGEKITTPESLWELANNYVPIIARSFPGVRELTKTSRDSPISPLERLMGSLGLKVNRTSPITKTYTMAHDWKTAQGIPADTGTYPVSKYQQMRYALEDNNQEKAADEFQKLLDAAGGDRKKVLAGFHESLNHPFTESMAMDKKFRDSLDGPSRAIYDAAKDRRHEIMRRFNEMKALEVRAAAR